MMGLLREMIIFCIIIYFGYFTNDQLSAFCIEPMINMGTYEVFIDEADGWTVCTDDGLPSAQWESMILITENGNEILTE